MTDFKSCRYGIKSYKDVQFVLILFANFVLWCVFYSRDRMDAIFISPLWLIAAVVAGILIVEGRNAFKSSVKPEPTAPSIKDDLINTSMMTVGDDFKSCIIQVSKGSVTVFPDRIKIPFENLSQILLQQKEHVSGFSLDYTDHGGRARLMFVNQGSLAYRKTKKQVALIQEAHAKWFAGCDVTPLAVANLTEIERAYKSSVVHRDLGPL